VALTLFDPHFDLGHQQVGQALGTAGVTGLSLLTFAAVVNSAPAFSPALRLRAPFFSGGDLIRGGDLRGTVRLSSARA
jgi:hypothetical protein